jgi:hypothetical protein
MAENIFDVGGSFSKNVDSSIKVDSPDRDRVISIVNKLSKDDLESLYNDMKGVESRAFEKNTSQTNIINERYTIKLKELDTKYNLSGTNSLSEIFNFSEASRDFSGNTTKEYFELLQFHIGASLRSKKVETLAYNYFEKLNNGLSNGDIVYVTNSRPCPKFDMSKSPYERVKKIWENLKSNVGVFQGSDGDQSLGFRVKADLSFLPQDAQKMVRDFLVSAYNLELENTGEFERSIYENGFQMPIDVGSNQGSYTKQPSVTLAINEKEKLEAINDLFEPYSMPPEIYESFEKTSDGMKNITPEYAVAILDYFFQNNQSTIQEFTKEYERFKKLSPEKQKEQLNSGSFFENFTFKKSFVIGIMSILSVMEIAKLKEVIKSGSGLAGHTAHTFAKYQGYLEIFANFIKTMYYYTNGKPLEGTKQLGIGIISALAEFGFPTAGLRLVSAFPTFAESLSFLFGRGLGAAGGYVGLAISALQFTHEFVVKPAKIRSIISQYQPMIDRLLDLERQMIEKECCVKIHPVLYRKTKGQLSVNMSPDGFIPFEGEYNRTVRGDGESLNSVEDVVAGPKQSNPCESNGQIPVSTSKRYIKVLSAQEQQFLGKLPSNIAGPPTEPIYIVDPRPNEDPCKKKEIIVRPSDGDRNSTIGQEGGDIGETSQYGLDKTSEKTPNWSELEERNLTNAIIQYNTNYISDVYAFKINAAKCKTGEIPSVTPTGGGAPDRDGFSPLAGESGMPGGFHRVGISRIVDISIEEDFSSAATDSSAMGGSGGKNWVAIWESYTRENGFSTGAGGVGTGNKLRGITTFFYDPLNPPKPIEMV